MKTIAEFSELNQPNKGELTHRYSLVLDTDSTSHKGTVNSDFAPLKFSAQDDTPEMALS